MNRTWLATSLLTLGLGANLPAAQFQFEAASTNDVKHFNPVLSSYLGVATSGTNYFCVGSNSIASFAATAAPVAGGYLTNYTAWTAQNVTAGYNLNAVAYGAGLYLAAGFNNATFTYDTAWSGPLLALPGCTVNAQGVAASSASALVSDFALITASYQAAWAPANPTTWHAAADTNATALESFRGLTSLGGNRFALCGIRGDVRLSQDGGHSWNTNLIFDFAQPDLYGIASDGANSLVTVGTAGTVKVSVNGGTNWAVNSVPGHAGDTFYAAAYTGSADNQFIVVGSGGDIFMATNNTATNVWTWQTNYTSGTARNLHGTAAATSGPLQGTIMAVGDDGAIVIGGTSPLPPLNLGNQTNCTGAPNPPLVVQVVPDADHPAGSVTVDWFDAQMAPLTNSARYAVSGNRDTGLFTNLTQDALSPNPPAVSNFVYYVRARDLRTGFLSATNTITLTLTPGSSSALLSFISIDCNADAVYTLTNILTGEGPWTVVWNDGYSQTTNATGGGPATLLRTVYPANGQDPDLATTNVYYVVGVSNADSCTANITGAVTNIITPVPAAILASFVVTDCNEGPVYTLTNTLTGLGPWTVVWNDGYVQTTNAPVGSSATLLRTVYPTNTFAAETPSNNVFYVVGLSNANLCAGIVSGTVTDIINPRPTASLLSFISTDCNEGPVYTLTNTLTGIGPWTITWNDGTLQTTNYSGPGPVTLTRTVYPTNTFGANAASNTVYFVTHVVDATGCVGDQPGDITGVVKVIINPRPTASLLPFLATDCNDGPVYTLTNTLTGFGPWVVSWNDGFIQTNAAATNGPVFLTRTVYPTNSPASYEQSNNVFYVINLVGANSCAGDQQGDLTGLASITINATPPAPTAPVGGTGTWTDSAGDIIETNMLSAPQYLSVMPLPNYLVDWFDSTRTNLLASNSAVLVPSNVVCGFYTNYVQVQDPDTLCLSPGLVAVVQVLIPPAPASLGDQTNNALVPNPPLLVSPYTDANNPPGRILTDWYDAPTTGNLLAFGTNSYTPAISGTYWTGARDSLTSLLSTNRTAVTLVSVTNPPCVVISATNQISATNPVVYFDGLSTEPNDFQLVNYQGLSWSNFWVVDAETPSILFSGYYNLAAALPPATNVCFNGGNSPASITNATPFNFISGWFDAAWNDGLELEIKGYDSGQLVYDFTYVFNDPWTPVYLALNFTNVTEVDFNSYGGSTDDDLQNTGSGDGFAMDDLLIVTNANVVCPEPDAPAPADTGYETNCVGVANPSLMVEAAPGDTVNWYADSTGTNLLARGVATNSFIPTDTQPGSYTYYAQAVDPNNYVSTNLTPVTLVLEYCSYLAQVMPQGRPPTNTVVNWHGNLLLESTTNLTDPVIWVTNSIGLPGVSNSWTNSDVGLPAQYFRLRAPAH